MMATVMRLGLKGLGSLSMSGRNGSLRVLEGFGALVCIFRHTRNPKS